MEVISWYKIIFQGEIVALKDTLKDDKIKDLETMSVVNVPF